MLKIAILNDFRNLKRDTIYDLSTLDKLKSMILVGDNGCGKSSLLHALRGTKDDTNTNTAGGSLYTTDFKLLQSNINVEHDYEKIFFLDSIKDNGMDLNNAYDAVEFVNSGGFHTKDRSHGEASLIYLSLFLSKIKDRIVENKTLIVLDEVDKGLSLSKQLKMYDIINNLVYKFKVHVLVVSHNALLIQKSEIVFDIEKNGMEVSPKYLSDKTGATITLY